MTRSVYQVLAIWGAAFMRLEFVLGKLLVRLRTPSHRVLANLGGKVAAGT